MVYFDQRATLRNFEIISINNTKTIFTSKIEENGLLSFLDKKSALFSSIFTNFESYKRRLIGTLIHRSFRLCSTYENFHWEIETLKSTFKHNSYPHNLVNHCIKKFLNKLFIQRDLNFIVPKMGLICVLPYLGKTSLDLRTRLRRTIEGIYHIVN